MLGSFTTGQPVQPLTQQPLWFTVNYTSLLLTIQMDLIVLLLSVFKSTIFGI